MQNPFLVCPGVLIWCRGSLRCCRVSEWAAAPSSQSSLPAPGPQRAVRGTPPLSSTERTPPCLLSWPAASPVERPAPGTCAALPWRRRPGARRHHQLGRRGKSLRLWSSRTPSSDWSPESYTGGEMKERENEQIWKCNLSKKLYVNVLLVLWHQLGAAPKIFMQYQVKFCENGGVFCLVLLHLYLCILSNMFVWK